MTIVAPLRRAEARDAPATAALHAAGIADGFLPRLGPRVLERLHRRMTMDRSSFVLVADAGPRVLGFVAGTVDVSRLYRSFLLRDGVWAAVLAVPRAPVLWRGALETLRFPGQAGDEWPRAELLSIVVDEGARGTGVGSRLVHAFQDEMNQRGCPSAKVVVASDNVPASALYRSAGFRYLASTEVHAGRRSDLLVWP